MKKFFIDKKKLFEQTLTNIFYWFFLIMIVILCVWMWNSEYHFKTIYNTDYSKIWFGDDWYYVDADGNPDYERPAIPSKNHYIRLDATDGKVSIAKTVNKDIKANEYFIFRARTSKLTIWINDQVWYEEQFNNGGKKELMPIYRMHQIEANGMNEGDVIRISMENPGSNSFIFQYPAIGDRYGLFRYITTATRTSWFIAFATAALLILNILAAHSPLLVENKRSRYSLKWLNSFLVISAIYVCVDTGWISLIYARDYTFNWISGIAMIMIPMPFLMYTQEAFFPGYKRFGNISACNLVIALWSIARLMSTGYNLSNSFKYVHIIIFVGIVCAIVSLIQEKEIPSPEIIIGYLFIIVTAVLSIYCYWKNVTYPFSTIYGYGFIVYCLFMLIWFVRSSNELRKTREAMNMAFIEREKKEAEVANEQKSSFLSHMSHEIRTPLNAVLGMNELIMNETDDNNILHYAKNIENSGHTLLALINDVLDFSKIENGKMNIIDSDYSLSQILNDAIIMVKERARNKNLDFRIEVAENIPDVLFGDEIRIKQIIINFLTNAIKYTSSGWVKLKVYMEDMENVQKRDMISLHIEVSDSGMGIKKDEIPLLFKEFECLDQKKNKSIEGTGLGLSITSKLVELMNGTIEVESEYGIGSTFKVILPQKVISDERIGNYKDRLDKLDEENLKQKAVHNTYKGKSVFVVDDNELNLEVIAGLLEMLEITVDKASSGLDAIKILDEKVYDLILTDDMMPQMNGTQLMQYIKSNDKGANENTPIVVLTANAIVGAREDYIRRGFDDYLSKPIDIDVLQKILTKYLKD